VPIHILFEAYLGLPLVHHLDLERLSQALADRERKAVMFMVAPLVLLQGTGSPVNPIAIL
jgi:hypothetical protein